jgi:glycine cleavage system H protein
VSQDCNPLSYKRSRFSSRLPQDRLYAPSHFWLLQIEPDLYQVGFTKFATRMLGDLVEYGFETKPGSKVAVGQTIGWVEGFKALTDIYCVADGEFVEINPALAKDPTLTDSDPYGAGWLYTVRGTPDTNATDVHGYIRLLDLTIDKMQEKSEQ